MTWSFILVAAASAGLAAPGAAAAQAPTCFGAPAMDPTHPCVDRSTTVTPLPDAIASERKHVCRAVKAPQGVSACAFGASKSKARLSFALLGDSHTVAWRAALSEIGRSERWRGYSLAQVACVFSKAAKALLSAAARTPCLAAYAATMKWLRQHREIDAVITTHEADTQLKVPPGKSLDSVKIAGFRRTWRAFPRNIRRVIVLRDTPNASPDELACVKRAAAAAVVPAGPLCAVPREWALSSDAAVQAAKGLHSGRYRAIDLTDLICSSSLCYPAVGGVLVNTDLTGHVSHTFARTAKPYLLRRLKPLLPSS